METAVALPKSVFSTTSSPKMSPRYVHINSYEVLDLMQQEGFVVASGTSTKVRPGREPLYAKHQVDLRLPNAPVVDGAVPRILFTNSHDGSTSAKFMMGVYRFICSNGLVIGSTYAREVARHSGEQAAQLIDRVRALAKNTGPMFAQIEAWSKRELSDTEAQELASLASVLRFGDVNRFDPKQLLATRRGEDEGRSLWRVFNRIQENAMAGGLVGFSTDGRRLASRPVRNIDQNTQFNADLWRLAEEFAS